MLRRVVYLLAVAVLSLVGITAPALPVAGSPSADRPWMRPGLDPAQRAQALLARMTLDEKIAMVHGDDFPPKGTHAGHVPGNARLGIPDLWLADGPNGVGNGSTGVTAFPTAVADAATWDPTVAYEYGRALGQEQAGKGHNVALAPTLNILRTPLWGRASESFTEDPYLNGQTATAEVRGIQDQHVIATPKHVVANNQETGRQGVPVIGGPAVNEPISERALQEIYHPGFKATVQQGGAGAMMCGYNQVNGAYACQNPQTLGTLKAGWGFDGPVMSDWTFATRDTVAAAGAGLDMEMPLGTHFGDALKAAVQAGTVPVSRLDDMVRRVLTAMFRIGLFDHPVSGNESAMVSTPAHRRLARQIAEQGSVLLRNVRGVLPLDSRLRTLAVIGTDAGDAAQIGEGGSGTVVPSERVTPLAGIAARAGSGVQVSYAPGTLGTAPLPILPAGLLTPADGNGQGLLGTYYATPDLSGAPISTRIDPALDFTTPPVAGLPTVWSARWTGTLTPPATGDYRFSVNAAGTFRLWVDGRKLVDNKYADFPATAAPAPVHLTAGRPVTIRIEYSPAESIVGTSLHLGWQPPDPAVRQRAVDAARAADVAVVFAGDTTGEGGDRTDLALPGDSDQLIHDVAAANPRTVVVLNTGSAVSMPWLHEVAGVIEAWYPGQEFGNAIAALLFGDVSPSGRLPMTWPASTRQGPASSYGDLHLRTERYDEGTLVGYRWYDATGQQPLFPFGYGLSYTTFRYSDLQITCHCRNATVSVRVTNTGHRPGSDVSQLYLGDPAAAQEPPKQLRGYRKVTLQPGESTRVTFHLDADAFATYDASLQRWTVHPGTYLVMVGGSSRDIHAAERLPIDVGT